MPQKFLSILVVNGFTSILIMHYDFFEIFLNHQEQIILVKNFKEKQYLLKTLQFTELL